MICPHCRRFFFTPAALVDHLEARISSAVSTASASTALPECPPVAG